MHYKQKLVKGFILCVNFLVLILTNLNLVFSLSHVSWVFSTLVTAWGGNVRVQERDNMERTIKSCLSLLKSKELVSVEDIFKIACDRKLDSILKDKTHPLFVFIEFSIRSGRLIHIKTTTSRHLNFFYLMQ